MLHDVRHQDSPISGPYDENPAIFRGRLPTLLAPAHCTRVVRLSACGSRRFNITRHQHRPSMISRNGPRRAILRMPDEGSGRPPGGVATTPGEGSNTMPELVLSIMLHRQRSDTCYTRRRCNQGHRQSSHHLRARMWAYTIHSESKN